MYFYGFDDWKKGLDRWLTTPPEDEHEEESSFTCEGDRCDTVFYPDDDVYELDGYYFCRECALEWLDQHKRTVTEGECYGE